MGSTRRLEIVGACLALAAIVLIGEPPSAPAQAQQHPVIAAAGDIACDPSSEAFNGGNGSGLRCRQMATSDLIVAMDADAVLVLGDSQYPCAATADIMASYDPSWGRVKDITHPAPGNHEYSSSGDGCDSEATGYYSYFGTAAGDPAKGYYSYDLGEWHVIALNSQCGKAGGCQAGSAQEQWLRNDLAANGGRCTLAYWHHPRWSSGNRHGSSSATGDLVAALYDAKADVILAGHDHNYERFAPQDPDGNADPISGIRQFVVGTGGKSVNGFDTPLANSDRRGEVPGVLSMTLGPGWYDWEFLPIEGESFDDSGSADCHIAGGATAPNTVIDQAPDSVSSTSAATFEFSSNLADSTFECSLDGDEFAACSSPATYEGLVDGEHVFAVRARSPEERLDPTPAVWEWTIGPVVVLAPDADARLRADRPTSNYGDSVVLGVDQEPLEESLIRFVVPPHPGPVTQATLRLYASDGSSNGPEVFLAEGDWSEATVTWDDRPARIGARLDDVGDVPSSTWVEFDVTEAVTTTGEITFNLVADHSNGVDFRSREGDSSRRPELVLRYGGQEPPVPTAQTVILSPIADATIDAERPDSNFGLGLRLKADDDPKRTAYVMFDLAGLGNVNSALLRLHVSNPTNDGPRVLAVSTDWSEEDITWNSRPTAIRGLVADTGRLETDEWAEYDVTSAARAGERIAFRLAPDSPNGAHFRSSESSRPPQLVVVHEAGRATTQTFSPVADGFVSQASPDDNFGERAVLFMDGAPDVKEGYLRFDVAVGAEVTSATLRLWVRNGSKNGPFLSLAGNEWSEESLTWNTKPPPTSEPVADVANAPLHTWVEYDVSAVVSGSGTLTFRLVSESADGVFFAAREAHRSPVLVVTTRG